MVRFGLACLYCGDGNLVHVNDEMEVENDDVRNEKPGLRSRLERHGILV